MQGPDEAFEKRLHIKLDGRRRDQLLLHDCGRRQLIDASRPSACGRVQRIKNNKRRDEVLSILRDLEPFRDEWEFSNAIQACGAVGDANALADCSSTRCRAGASGRRCTASTRASRPSATKANGQTRSSSWTRWTRWASNRPYTPSARPSLRWTRRASPTRAVRLLKKVERPDSYCYCPVIHALGSANRPDDAMDLLEEVIRRRVEKPLSCFNAALHALATAGRQAGGGLARADALLFRACE